MGIYFYRGRNFKLKVVKLDYLSRRKKIEKVSMYVRILGEKETFLFFELRRPHVISKR